jgi:hypothetical protein
MVIRDSSTGQLLQVTAHLFHENAIRVQVSQILSPQHTTEQSCHAMLEICAQRSSRPRCRIVTRHAQTFSAHRAPTCSSPLIDVERAVELVANVLDAPFVDDLFTHQIGDVEDVDGPRRLGGDLGQVNVNTDLE